VTIAAAPHEIWRPEDGAPAGPEFDVLVPSTSEPGREYRVARDAGNVIYHRPACQAFRFGHHRCAHVRRAIELAEDPAWTFVADVVAAWNAGGWDPRHRAQFGAEVFRGAQAALQRRAALEEIAERAAAPAPDPQEALERHAHSPIRVV
jgi:hypothetical protein